MEDGWKTLNEAWKFTCVTTILNAKFNAISLPLLQKTNCDEYSRNGSQGRGGHLQRGMGSR